MSIVRLPILFLKYGCDLLRIDYLGRPITKTHLCNVLQFFTVIKTNNFQMKMFDIILIFAQNIECRYTLEPPQ